MITWVLNLSSQPLKTLTQTKENSFAQLQQYFENYFKQFEEVSGENANDSEKEKDNSYKIYKRWENFMEPRVLPTGQLNYEQKIEEQYEILKRVYGNRSLTTAENWSIVGPTNVIPTGGGAGRLNCITVDPNNANSIWVGAPAGGLWHSLDGGNTWTTNTDLLPILGISCIAIDPSNSQIMYISTGDGDAGNTYSIGLMKSTNGGINWTITGMNNAVANYGATRKILINPANTSHLVVCTDNAIYYSTNAGASWTQTIQANFFDLKFKAGSNNTIFAASTTAIFTSHNFGVTWVQDTTGFPTTGVGRICLATTPTDSNIVYAHCADVNNWGFYGFYRSSDGGTSWTQMSNQPNTMGWDNAGGDVGGQGWYTLSCAAFGDTIYTGGVNIWKSTDGGATWNCNAHWYGAAGLPYVHADIHELAFFNNKIYAACDGGLFVTSNFGQTWQDKSNGLEIAQYYRFGNSATNPNLFYAGAQDNGTARYNNSVWNNVLGGDGMEALIDFTNPNFCYGTSQGGNLLHSIDGGNNWGNITPPNAGAWVTPYVINPQNHNSIFYGGLTVYKSLNQGIGWTNIGSNIDGLGNFNALAVAPSDSNTIYVSVGNKLYKTSDEGNNWISLNGNFPFSLPYITYIAFDNTNKNHVWITCSGFSAGRKVFETEDGGNHWDNVSAGLPNIPVNCIVFQNNSQNILYCGTDLGVYYKSDYLSNWIRVNNNLPNVIVDELEFQYSSGKLRAATYGRGVWQTDTIPIVNYYIDAGVKKITNPQFVCSSSFSPSVVVKNYGTASINHLQINYRIDTGALVVYNFNGNFSSLNSMSINLLPTMVSGAGQHTITVYTFNPNNLGTDNFTSNDTMQFVFNFVPRDTLPFVQDFESGIFPPAMWQITNSDGQNTWEAAGVGGWCDSPNSMTIDNYWYNLNGALDNFVSPLIDLTNYMAPVSVSFDLAYARYAPGYRDSLFVVVSADCGEHWTRVYAKGDSGISTAPDYAAPFSPNCTQWRTDTTYLNGFAGMSEVMIAIQNRNGYGNYLYIDNINITAQKIPTQINEIPEDFRFVIYPNPANEELNFSFSNEGNYQIKILDLMGKELQSFNASIQNSKFNIQNLSAGFYFVEVKTDDKMCRQKIVIVK